MVTRNGILSAILGRSGTYPNCKVRGKGDTLFIDLFNSVGKLVYIFEAKIKGNIQKELKTYYKICEYLFNNPQIKLICEKPQIKKIIEV